MLGIVMTKDRRFFRGRLGWFSVPAVILLAVTGLIGGAAWGQVGPPPGGGALGPRVAEVEAELVGVEVVPQFDVVRAGGRLLLAVVLDVQEGWHLYANPKQGEYGLDTEIIPSSSEAQVSFGRAIYPPGREYRDKVLKAANHIYEGKVVCYVPVEVGDDVAGQVQIDLSLKGLLCSDAGVCRPWQDRAGVVIGTAPDAAGEVATEKPELFAGVAATGNGGAGVAEQGGIGSGEWLKPILLALLAGLLMNLMPCVLPIIPIVILTLVKQCAGEAGEVVDRRRSVKVGLAFAGGILIVFAGLAVLLSVFTLFWGQHFQSSGFKFALLMVVYVLGLAMFGLFEIVLPAGISNIQVVRKGYFGALGMGMLATVLATPCGAPLLGPVLAWSLAKPAAVTVAVCLIVGAGMASPYVLLTAFPKLLGRVPKAGNWMIRLKQALGFFMLGFAVYLLLLFPAGWHGPLLYYALTVGFCVWLGLSVGHSAKGGRKVLARVVALVMLVIASTGLGVFWQSYEPDEGTDTGEYWLAQLQGYQQQGQTVIVKFTANWCKNCATLDQTIYKRQVFKDKLAATGAALVIADWSNEDAEIKQMIGQLGGPGQSLPFAVVFVGGDANNTILLRDFYSLDQTLEALDEAHRRVRSAGP